MSTRSRIGAINSDGTITSIYCHNDGYPSHNGRILATHYNDEEKVRALLALGDISALRPKLAPPSGVSHSYRNALPDVVIAYARDRGEDGVKAITHAADRWPESGQEYTYLWRGGTWEVR